MTETFVVQTRDAEKLLMLLAKGLFSGDVLSVHKVSPRDLPHLATDRPPHS